MKKLNKFQVFVDFDDVITNSNLRIGEIYADEFNVDHPGELTTWDGAQQIPLAPKGWMENTFNTYEFFNNLKIKDGFFETLSKIDRDNFQLIMCSLGMPINIQAKTDFVQKYQLYKYFDDIVFTVKYDNCKPSKNFTNPNAVFIDDHQDNLKHVKHPILFNDGLPKEWNKGYSGFEISGWNDELLKIINHCYSISNLRIKPGFL